MISLEVVGAIVAIILVVLLASVLLALKLRGGARHPVLGGSEGGTPAIHILVPYRAGPKQPEREDQLRQFLGHFAEWGAAPGHHIHVVEQVDGLPFNRGALLNAGFDMVREKGGGLDDIYIFHDVDLLPDRALLQQYGDPPPVHFAAVWDRYGVDKGGRINAGYLGGVLSLTGRQFVRTGGYPNDFWGWGGEDNLLRDRIKQAGLWGEVRRPARGRLRDLEGMTLGKKMQFLKDRGLKFMRVREQMAHHRGRHKRGLPATGLDKIGDVYELEPPIRIQGCARVYTVALRRHSPLRVQYEAPRPGGAGAGAPPHADDFQKRLESRIPGDLAPFPDRGDGAYRAMRKYALANLKYLRSCVFVEAGAGRVTCEIPDAKWSGWGAHPPDSRTRTFAAIVRDLVGWCRGHGLPFPAGKYVVYVTDSYAWEAGAKGLPWMVVARPENRAGILVPDDSFVTHGERGERVPPGPGKPWAWDAVVETAKGIWQAAPAPAKSPGLFFAGADTGADKYAVRRLLAKEAWAVPATIRLLGQNAPKNRTSVLSWGRHGALLNLPGHQPWSYRLKYLFLSGSPVFNVEATVAFPGGETTGRWVQFFSHVFEPGADYVELVLEDRDAAGRGERARNARRLREAIETEYRGLAPAAGRRMAASAFEKAARLSRSRLLQYYHALFRAYASQPE